MQIATAAPPYVQLSCCALVPGPQVESPHTNSTENQQQRTRQITRNYSSLVDKSSVSFRVCRVVDPLQGRIFSPVCTQRHVSTLPTALGGSRANTRTNGVSSGHGRWTRCYLQLSAIKISRIPRLGATKQPMRDGRPTSMD